MGAAVGYQIAGGLGAESRNVTPLTRGPDATLQLTYAATPHDLLSSGVNGFYAKVTPPDSTFTLVGAREGWAHAWSAATQGVAGIGVAYLRTRNAVAAENKGSLLPTADASLIHTIHLNDGALLSLIAGTRLGVLYNPVLGTYTEQLSEAAGANWLRGRFNAGGFVGAAQTLSESGPNATRAITANVLAGYAPNRALQLQVGARTAVETLPQANGGSYPLQWGAFALVTFTGPDYKIFGSQAKAKAKAKPK